MHRSNKLAFVNLGQFFLDIVFLLLSYIISYIVACKFTHLFPIDQYMWVLIVFIPLWVLVMSSLGMYNRTTFNYYDRILRNVLFSSLVSAASLASLMFFIKEVMFSRAFYGGFVVASTVLTLIERYIYVSYFNKNRVNSAKRVIIVGVPDVAMKFLYYIKKTNIRLDIIGYVQVNDENPFKSRKKLGRIEELENILKKDVVDEVIFTLPKDYMGEVEKYVLLCEEMGITVRMLLELYDLKIAKTNLSSIGTLPMLTFHSVSLNHFQLFAKRVIDIIGAIVGLTLTGICSIFIVTAIKLDSKGPALFSQDRVGLNGRVFKLYKFRSMHIDAEERKQELAEQNQVSGGLMFKIKNDPRITQIGAFLRKTSLDELPQFINVLKGDMSLVGTRPPTVDEVSNYENHHYRRISIKPGITGLWQVSGRSSIIEFDEVVKLDTQYIDEWSIWMDFKIMFKTFLVIFNRKGAY